MARAQNLTTVLLKGALVTALLLSTTTACGSSDNEQRGAPSSAAVTWEDIQKAACRNQSPATDHDDAVRATLSPEELDIFNEAEAAAGDPSGQLEYLSCGSSPPFLR